MSSAREWASYATRQVGAIGTVIAVPFLLNLYGVLHGNPPFKSAEIPVLPYRGGVIIAFPVRTLLQRQFAVLARFFFRFRSAGRRGDYVAFVHPNQPDALRRPPSLANFA